MWYSCEIFFLYTKGFDMPLEIRRGGAKDSTIDISSNIFGSSSFTFKKRTKLDKSFKIFYKKLTTPTDVSLNFKLKDDFSMLQPSRIQNS